MTTPFDAYLAQIQADLQGGKATEHTYRSSIETLLESLTPHIKASNIGDGVIGRQVAAETRYHTTHPVITDENE